ncbi:MAG: hypothetical protein IVW54_12285 [Candidatus Binataceae bacterium]|nr:hypothetical protein [Candidatus Binataceae bacterium]
MAKKIQGQDTPPTLIDINIASGDEFEISCRSACQLTVGTGEHYKCCQLGAKSASLIA